MENEKQSVSKAFGAFSKKLKAFVASEGEDPKFESGSSLLQERIKEREAVRYNNIVSYYKKFTTPDASIAEDQENLLKAYNLYKGLRTLNQQAGDQNSFIKASEIISPLTQKARYTSGGDFIYLTAWFLYEKQIEDFVPLLEKREDGREGNGTISFLLDFVTPQKKPFSIHDREILGIIKKEFYS